MIKKYNPGMKTKLGFPIKKIYDDNFDRHPDRTVLTTAMRGYCLQISRKPTQEEIKWYKSQD